MESGQSFRDFFQVAVISGFLLGLFIRIGSKETKLSEALTYVVSFIVLFCLIRVFM